MANSSQGLDLPIALRRTARNCVSAAAQSTQRRVVSAPPSAMLKTPSKPQSKKRVRFSDPGPELSRSTGLTPALQRSTIGGSSTKRRRKSAFVARKPASIQRTGSPEEDDVLSLPQADNNTGKSRRTRRNGLSGQAATTPKKSTKAATRKQKSAIQTTAEAEAQRLRAEIANRDAEIERLRNEALAHDAERIMQLEQQIEALRTEIAQSQLPALNAGDDDEDDDGIGGDDEEDLHSFYDWTLAARDPFSDSYLDGNDDSQDAAMADDVASSTPSRRQSASVALSRSASGSFPTPPCTSPPMPGTPCSMRRESRTPTPHSNAGVQASLSDPEKEALEAQLVSLRLELIKLTTTLEAHDALQARVSEQLASATSSSSVAGDGQSNQLGLEEQANSVLRTLSERTAALVELNSSLSSLGFGGTEANEIIGSLTSSLRSARLELEYLTPGEITLSLTSDGAQVLDLVLVRLRDLARKSQEDEETIDEYHAIELSLRQQLDARVDAMKGLRAEHEKTATLLRERDEHIADLEVGLDRLKGAAEGYRRDIVELETLVQTLEDNGKATEARLQADLDSAQSRLAERVSVIADLEAKLSNTLKQSNELETSLKEAQVRKEAEAKVRNKSASAALALRDARISELRREIYDINQSLRSAHETITKLRITNAELAYRAEKAEEQERIAKEALDTMRAELEKVTAAAAAVNVPRRRTRSSTRESRGLTTPEPQAGTFLSGDLARSGSGKGKRVRRYDSGLGLLVEDVIEFPS